MERVTGIEPVSQPWQGRRLPLHHTRIVRLVDRAGIEPAPAAYEADALPSVLTARLVPGEGLEPTRPKGGEA
jgi:hypothetical protein